MKITPPSGDIGEAQQSATQALYSLIMQVAEVTATGNMPAAGPTSMTRLDAAHVVDTIVHLVQISIEQGICPLCQAMRKSAEQHGLPFKSNHHERLIEPLV
jgi:hypothetical protein